MRTSIFPRILTLLPAALAPACVNGDDCDDPAPANVAPSVLVLSPASDVELAPGGTVEIRWVDGDPDDAATTDLVAVLQGTGTSAAEVAIALGLAEQDGAPSLLVWTPPALASGDWAIEARTSDADSTTFARAPGLVRVAPARELAAGIATAYGDATFHPFDVTSAPDGGALVCGTLSPWDTIFGPVVLGQDETNETELDPLGPSELFVAAFEPDAALRWAVQSTGTPFQGEEGNGSGSHVLAPACARHADGSLTVAFGLRGELALGAGEPGETVLANAAEQLDPGRVIARFSGADGSLLWARVVEGAHGSADRTALAVLPDGSSASAGDLPFEEVLFAGTPFSYLLDGTKFASWIAFWEPDGKLRVARPVAGYDASWNGATSDIVACAGLADGSVVVAGSYTTHLFFGAGGPNIVELTSSGRDDLFLACFAPNGDLAWVRTVRGASSETDLFPQALRATPDGELLLLACVQRGPARFGPGETQETLLGAALSGSDALNVLARFGPDGTLRWARDTTLGPDGLDPDELGLAVFQDGAALVATFIDEDLLVVAPGEPSETTLALPSSADENLLLARFGPDGALTWALNDGGGEESRATCAAPRPDGSAWVAGSYDWDNAKAPVELGYATPTPVLLPKSEADALFLAAWSAQGALLAP